MNPENVPVPDEELDETMIDGLKEILHVDSLSPETLARIRSAVEGEWRNRTFKTQRKNRWRAVGIAASILMTIGIALTWRHSSAERVEFGALVRAGAPGLEEKSGWFGRSVPRAGDRLRSGEKYAVFGAALIALQEGGTLRAAPGSVFEVLGANSIRFYGGQLYVDLPPENPRAATFYVATAAGRIEHVGTQFEIATLNRDIRIRVREGKIRLTNSSGLVVAEAGTELLASTSGAVARRLVATHGRDWAWVEALAPDYALDNQHLVNFLQWVARETGRKVEVTDVHAQHIVEETMLHGSARGLMPLEALSNVIATTSVRFQLRDDSIRVSSRE